jgi:hypothetical protein
MGIDYNTYVGYYVQCKVRLVEAMEARTTCPTPGCAHHGKYLTGTFCAGCGARIASVSFATRHPEVDAERVEHALASFLHVLPGDGAHHWMHAQGLHIWIPNFKLAPLGGVRFDPREEDFLIQPFMIAPNPLAFALSRDFAPAMSLLRKFYGEERVEVLWGLIHYAW